MSNVTQPAICFQDSRIRIVGVEPGRSWAARAHLPALQALSDDFEVSGVANSSLESSKKAAAATGLRKAFASVAEMAASPEVDSVAVTVKVPHHREFVRTVLESGKHIYCEWPLGNGLAEAEELAALVYKKMANDLRDHTHTAPDFEQAVALHRVLAAIEKAARVHTRI